MNAATLDGAGPLCILSSVILLQSIPVVTAAALLPFFYIWNKTRHSSPYLGVSSNLQLFPFGVLRNRRVLVSPATLRAGSDRQTDREIRK